MNLEISDAILDQILAERVRQHDLAHGGDTNGFDMSNSRNDWIAYVTAYIGRAAAKVSRNEREKCDYRDNLVKAGALIVAAIEAHDKGWS
jgi:hypothetical protein